jgi:hypothetical protein
MHVLADIRDGFHGPVSIVVLVIIAIIVLAWMARQFLRHR